MSDQVGFLSRIGNLFKGGNHKTNGNLPIHHAVSDAENGMSDEGGGGSGNNTDHAVGTLLHTGEANRSTFLRPWAKRDNAIGQLQDGFNALTGLMGAVKDSLDKQNQRQDELVRVLGQLPETLRSIPETGAAQTETLKAIAEQIKYQNAQQ